MIMNQFDARKTPHDFLIFGSGLDAKLWSLMDQIRV